MGLQTLYDRFSMFINAKSQGMTANLPWLCVPQRAFLDILTSIQEYRYSNT